MSGGGLIIEKKPVTLEDGRAVIRYAVIERYQDETCVYAEPQAEEPDLAESMWWGGRQIIWWGPNDSKTLTKVGFSFRAPWTRPLPPPPVGEKPARASEPKP